MEASLLAGETKKGFAVALEMEAEGHVLSPGQYHKLFQSALDTSFVEGAIHAFDYLCNRSPARFSLDTGAPFRAWCVCVRVRACVCECVCVCLGLCSRSNRFGSDRMRVRPSVCLVLPTRSVPLCLAPPPF